MAGCAFQVQWVTIATPRSSRGPSGQCLSVHFRWVIFRAAWARRHSPCWFTGLLGALLYLIRFPQSTQCNLSGYGLRSYKPLCVCLCVCLTLRSVSNSSWFPPALSLFLNFRHTQVYSGATHIHKHCLAFTHTAHQSDKNTIYSEIHWAIVWFSKAASSDSS